MLNVENTSDLAGRIAGKRAQLDAFIARMKPRRQRLVNVALVGGTLAAALTAGPAAGGVPFTAWLTATLGLTSPAWQILCAGAALSSVTATTATQLLRSQNIEEHVARAASCRAKLEALEISLAAGQIEPAQATAEYIKCVEETAFL